MYTYTLHHILSVCVHECANSLKVKGECSNSRFRSVTVYDDSLEFNSVGINKYQWFAISVAGSRDQETMQMR